MIYLLFVVLLLGLFLSYILTNRDILSCSVIGHAVYLLSTFVLVLNYDDLCYDISFNTVCIIEGSLLFLFIGEFIGRNNTYTPTSNNVVKLPIIKISKSNFILYICVLVLNTFYSYYRFNYVGSVLGGGNFVSKYMFVRSYLTTEEGVRGLDSISVPYSSMFSYLQFFATGIFFTFVFVYFYMLFFKSIKDKRLLISLLIYVPVLLFSTTRSIFINTISISSIIIFLLFIQSHKGLNVYRLNKKIIKWGLIALVSFFVIFVGVGSLKEQDVLGNTGGIMTGYAGASIIGLDQYVEGKIEAKSDYPGQVTLEGLVSFLNHFGFDHKLASYHQDDFTYGNNVSNIFAAPYYMLRDFPIPIMLLIHLGWGVIISYLISKIKNYRVPQYLPYNYIIVGYLYYPVVMLPITDAFRHIIGMPFFYTIISLLIIQKYLIKKSLYF